MLFFFKEKKHSFSGMTLIEVLIALGIAAGIMAFVAGSIGDSSDKEIKQASSALIRMIKHAYMQATLTNKYYRIGFDLTQEAQSFVLEYSAEPFYIVKVDDEMEAIRLDNEDHMMGDDEESAGGASGEGDFAESEDELAERYELSTEIKIIDVRTEHMEEAVTDGAVQIYFFPKGYTQFSVIHLSDFSETIFVTLIINPLTAQVNMVEDFIEYDEALELINENGES